LNDPSLPQPRLKPASPNAEWLMVPAYTDFKLHDITDPNDHYAEALDMNQTVWADKFHGGNRRFLTKRLWGSANEPPYFHHGMFTTLRKAVLAHSGEALEPRKSFESLPEYDKDSLIEFLKSLQVLPPGTKDLIVDENYKRKVWSSARQNHAPQISKRVPRSPTESAATTPQSRDKRYLLSNFHVLADSGKGKPGDKVVYPGPDDNGQVPGDWGASLTKAVPFKKGGEFINEVDAALAEIRYIDTTRLVHCHNKLIIIDGQTVLTSSQNWSKAAVLGSLKWIVLQSETGCR